MAASGSHDVSPAATTTYTLTATGPGGAANKAVTVTVGTGVVQHYEYVFPDQGMYVYDLDNNFALVKYVPIPQAKGIRGVAAVPGTNMLYIAYGGDGGINGTGSLLEYDLLTDTVVWTKSYSFGIDSFAITPDGATIYMPTGVNSSNGLWYIIDPNTGNVTGSINTGLRSPHNTIVSLDGAYVFMGPQQSPYPVRANTATNSVVLPNIGPLMGGVRTFTINGKHTLSFTTIQGFLGFQVSDTTSEKVLYTVSVPGLSIPAGMMACHGISLSPDEKEIYLIDVANHDLHVFDVSGLPGSAPTLVASIPLTSTFSGTESPCLYDCVQEGWLNHSQDGRFVFVGDSGDVIDTSTRKIIATLTPLANTRKFLEIDWQNGWAISATSRYGVGYVTQ